MKIVALHGVMQVYSNAAFNIPQNAHKRYTSKFLQKANFSFPFDCEMDY